MFKLMMRILSLSVVALGVILTSEWCNPNFITDPKKFAPQPVTSSTQWILTVIAAIFVTGVAVMVRTLRSEPRATAAAR